MFKVTVTFIVDPTEYHEPPTLEMAEVLALAMLHSETDWPGDWGVFNPDDPNMTLVVEPHA